MVSEGKITSWQGGMAAEAGNLTDHIFNGKQETESAN